MVGDLKHGRTVHSLAKLLTMYSDSMLKIEVVFSSSSLILIIHFFLESISLHYVSPPSLAMPQDIIDCVGKAGIPQVFIL
jgi:carbamoyl-phosphate synthase/aspartate carbamoyltransferase/dihydroorotase